MRSVVFGLAILVGSIAAADPRPAPKTKPVKAKPAPRATTEQERQAKKLEEQDAALKARLVDSLGPDTPVDRARSSGSLSDLDRQVVCKCDAPADVDQRISDAKTFTAFSFKAALAKRQLELDRLTTIELTPDDHLDKIESGKTATITRDGHRTRVRIRTSFGSPEVVRDAQGMFHDLVREPDDKTEVYQRRDRNPGGDGRAEVVRPYRVGDVVDKLGAPITLRYPSHVVVASYCNKQ